MDKKKLLRRNVWLRMLHFNTYLFFLIRNFFLNLHFDRADKIFTCFRERAGAQFQNRVPKKEEKHFLKFDFT